MTNDGCGKQIATAIDAIQTFVSESTGSAPTESEIARALTRYFVLKEICEHIEMNRDNPEW